MARPQDTALARFYGLPKVHKDGVPLRPIVSLKGTPTYGLAKWLFRRLKFLTAESDTTVSSSAQFLEKLKGDLAIETIELLLQSKYDETENRLGHAQNPSVPEALSQDVLHVRRDSLRAGEGHTNGFVDFGIHRRGGPATVRVAGLPTPQTEVLGPVLTFQEHLNAVFPDIQFTMEEEENNQLDFLDVLVCRKDCGGLKTKVFRKATNTMQVLNFNSNHPISHKRSCVRTLYRRVETHCSEPEDKIAELQYLRRVFKANGYPRNFVNRCIRKRDKRPNRTDTKSWRALPPTTWEGNDEHKLAIHQRDPSSPFLARALEHSYRFNRDGIEVVAMANTKQAREFLEAWEFGTTSTSPHVDLDAHYEGLRAQPTDVRP
ncbi:hypothetical protein SprV_0100275500 [Sparganum proliferum]